MAKYDGIKENIGQIMCEELYSDISDTYITDNELLKAKLIKKFNEIYNFALIEAQAELQDAMDAIKSLKVK